MMVTVKVEKKEDASAKKKATAHIHTHEHIQKNICNKRKEQLEKKSCFSKQKIVSKWLPFYLAVLLDFFDVAFCLCSGSAFACARILEKKIIFVTAKRSFHFCFSPCLLFSNVTFLLTHCGNQKRKALFLGTTFAVSIIVCGCLILYKQSIKRLNHFVMSENTAQQQHRRVVFLHLPPDLSRAAFVDSLRTASLDQLAAVALPPRVDDHVQRSTQFRSSGSLHGTDRSETCGGVGLQSWPQPQKWARCCCCCTESSDIECEAWCCGSWNGFLMPPAAAWQQSYGVGQYSLHQPAPSSSSSNFIPAAVGEEGRMGEGVNARTTLL